MDAIDAIQTRHMIPKVRPDRPTQAEIQQLIDLAVRAPNHHLTEPWRFYVLTGEGLELLARAMAKHDAGAQGKDANLPDVLAAARSKAQRAPVVIVVTCTPSTDPKVVASEDEQSVAMAIQNLLLGAHAKGLGAMLRTGAVLQYETLRSALELDGEEAIMGLIYVGYPEHERGLTQRTPSQTKTSWIGWD